VLQSPGAGYWAGATIELGRDPQHFRDTNRRAAEAVTDLLGISTDAEKAQPRH